MGKVRPRTVEQIERDARAVDLRRRHLSYSQIAKEMGWSKGNAYAAVKRGLGDSIFEAAEEVRAIELERLDDLSREATRVMLGTHYHLSAGSLVLDPETHKPLIDTAPKLKAIDTLLRIMKQRADLTGINAPVQIEMVTIGQVESEIARLSAELALRENA